MKNILFILSLSASILMAKSFTVSDPPMIYIYHFVSYDTTSIVLHGGSTDESQNKKLRLPLFNRNDLSSSDNVIVGKPLDPKLVSAMVTSAVAQNTHVNIAGESIQNRIKTDDFIKLVESEYNSKLRIKAMLNSDSSFSIDSETVAVPSGFLQVRDFYIVQGTVKYSLTYMAPTQMDQI